MLDIKITRTTSPKEKPQDETKPVSYTHLDVYKRQAIQFTQNFLGVQPKCGQVCKFVKEFRPDLLGVRTAGIEVPCKLVEVSAHLAALLSLIHIYSALEVAVRRIQQDFDFLMRYLPKLPDDSYAKRCV